MRDVLSHEGKSERTAARYLLRFSNAGARKTVRFMDQLPFFLRPLWHTFEVTVKSKDGSVQELKGVEAMTRLGLSFVPSDSSRAPTEVFITADIPAESTVSVVLNVMKIFIQLREFSYACEKGFDVGSAAWLELEATDTEISTADFADSLTTLSGDPLGRDAPRLRFTAGLLILVPMPDFSMPFNVIALSATAITFFFGSLFRVTSSGRQPHWVLKSDKVKRTTVWFIKQGLKAVVFGTGLWLYSVERKDVAELRNLLPPDVHLLVQFLLYVKDKIDDTMSEGH